MNGNEPRLSPRSESTSTKAVGPVCSPTAFSAPVSYSPPTPTLQPNGNYNVLASFQMTATFSNLGRAECNKCEYWQYIKGSLQYQEPGSSTWIPAYPVLYGGKLLSASTFQEDGCSTVHGICRYGHRGDAYHCSDMYYSNGTPDYANGCRYAGSDQPGFTNLAPGTKYKISLQFRGYIMNTVPNPAKRVRTMKWTVSGTGTVP
jgi:hypothetical protein